MAISREEIQIKLVGIDGVTRGYKRINQSQKNVQRQSRNTDKALNKGAGAFSGLTGALMGAHAAVGLLSAGLAGAQRAMNALKAPAGLAISFEEGFAKITTLLDGPTESFGKLRTQLLALASDVPQTAEDISLAAYQAISAGIPHEEVATFLRTASKAAVGAGATLTESVEVLTTAVNGFKTESMDADRAANILFATQKQGVTTVRELQQNLGKATGLAQFGVRMDEVTAAVAQMTKLGTPTSEAFTRVVAVVKALSQETGPAAKNLKALGVEVGVTALKNKGLSGVLADVQEKTGGSAKIISGLTRRFEAQDGMLKLLGPNFQDFNKILAGNRAETDFVGDAYDKLANTTQGAANSFSALKEGVLRELGDRMLPIINELITRLTALLKESGSSFVDVFAKGLEALFRFGVWVMENGDKLLITLGAIFGVKAGMALAAVLSGLIAKYTALSVAAAGAGASMAAAAKAAIMSPMGITALAAGALMLGKMIGDKIVDGQIEQMERRNKELSDFVENNARKMEARLKAAAGISVSNLKTIQSEVEGGERFGAGRTGVKLLSDDFDPEETRRQLESLNTPAEEFRKIQAEIVEEMEKGNVKIADEKELRQAAFEELEKRLNAEIEIRNTQIEAIDERRQAAEDELPALRRQLQMAELMVTHGIARGTYAKQVASLNYQIQSTEGQIAASALQRANAERAILKLKKQVAALDPNAKKPAFTKKPKATGGGGGKSKRQRELEELEKMENRSVETIGKLELRREKARRDRFLAESEILRGREVFVRDMQGREVKATEAHLEKLSKLDQLTFKKLTDENARISDEGDRKLEKLQIRQRKELEQIIKQNKMVEKLRAANKKRGSSLLAIGGEDAKEFRRTGENIAVFATPKPTRETSADDKEFKEALADFENTQKIMRDLRLSPKALSDTEILLFTLRKNSDSAQSLDDLFSDIKLSDSAVASLETLLGVQREELETLNKRVKAERQLKAEQEKRDSATRTAAIQGEIAADAGPQARFLTEKEKLQADHVSKIDELNQKELESGVSLNEEKEALETLHRQKVSNLTIEHYNQLEEIEKDYAIRTGEFKDGVYSSELAQLARQHEAELEMFQEHGLNIAELRKQQELEMNVATVQHFTNMVDGFATGAAATVGNIKGIMGAFGDLAQARMRSAQIDLKAGKITRAEYNKAQKQAGELQAKQIIAQGVYHGFQAVSEQAKAVSAFAEGFKNPVMFAAAAAHQSAAVMHAIRASMAGQMAAHARKGTAAAISGGGGGGGGGMAANPGQGSGYMERAELTEQQRENTGIRFGDIILADLPHLLSADGASELGRHIAGSVVEEINDNAFIAGGYRISRRSQRGV